MSFNSKKSVIFVPYKPHLKSFFEQLSISDTSKFFLVLPWDKTVCPRSDSLKSTITKHQWFGLRIINKFIKYQVHIPVYLSKIDKIFSDNNADTLVVFDFYHWYTFQCVRYVKKHPDVSLIIISETKRWPKNKMSYLMMRLFIDRLVSNQRHVSKILVYSNDGYEWWSSLNSGLSIELFPAPVDTCVFSSKLERQWMPEGTLRVLMNARYAPYKRHEDLLQAVHRLRDAGKKVHITLIGRAGEGREVVEGLVSQYGLQTQVTFLDTLPSTEMQSLYERQDLLVLPSFNEAIGMVVPEAMACGIPTITSDTVGANVYVKNGETGFIFKTGDVDQLYGYLNFFWKEENLARRMGKAGQKHIKSFDTKIVTNNFLKILTEANIK